MCIYVWAFTCHGTHMEARGSLFPVGQQLNTCNQASQQAPLLLSIPLARNLVLVEGWMLLKVKNLKIGRAFWSLHPPVSWRTAFTWDDFRQASMARHRGQGKSDTS